MLSTSVKVTAAPQFSSSRSHGGSGLAQATDSLVCDDFRGTLTWCERPPTFAELTSHDSSFIFPSDWLN